MTETCPSCGMTRFSWDGGYHLCAQPGDFLIRPESGSAAAFWGLRVGDEFRND